MKRLLATTAIATMAFAGAASAQSVLERVLGQIDNATNLASVNGTFANIAENIGSPGTAVFIEGSDGNLYTESEWDAIQSITAEDDYTVVPTGDYVNLATGEVVDPDTSTRFANAAEAAAAGFVVAGADEYYKGNTATAAENTVVSAADHEALDATYTAPTLADTVILEAGLVEGINGSINNTIDGITDVTQQATAGTVTAIEYNMPTFDFGDMATTALGAVNTGDITLGVNSAVDEASTSTTNAISAVVNQLGGSADTGAIILNVASNMTGVNGSINNVMEEVNGSIGNLSTTALGAVNTGTIVSGVDAAVAGIVGSTSGGAASN